MVDASLPGYVSISSHAVTTEKRNPYNAGFVCKVIATYIE